MRVWDGHEILGDLSDFTFGEYEESERDKHIEALTEKSREKALRILELNKRIVELSIESVNLQDELFSDVEKYLVDNGVDSDDFSYFNLLAIDDEKDAKIASMYNVKEIVEEFRDALETKPPFVLS